jgi:hypothetical protein
MQALAQGASEFRESAVTEEKDHNEKDDQVAKAESEHGGSFLSRRPNRQIT